MKKYSESRRERREIKQTNSTDSIQGEKSIEMKALQKSDGDNGKMDAQYDDSIEDNNKDSNYSGNGNGSGSGDTKSLQKDRSITNLRNKDRPSLQIYQPGKRRTSIHSESAQDQSGDKSSASSEKESSTKDLKSLDYDKCIKDGSTKNDDRRKRNDTRYSSKSYQDDGKKIANEKRVSRYSEKRNKVKEKRDMNVTDDVAGECNLNADIKTNM